MTMLWAGIWTRQSLELPSTLSGSVTVILQILSLGYIYMQIIFSNKQFFPVERPVILYFTIA